MKVKTPSISIKHEVIEIINKNTNEKEFLLKDNNKWLKITKDKYNEILRGNNNGENSNN